MDTRLIKIIKTAGQPTVQLSLSDGGRALILPHGGRILGLYASGSEENFLWTNPALRKADSARALFASNEWCNTGGDRTWLAPEVDFFFPHFPDTSIYFQPRRLDPGHYDCTRKGNGVHLTNRFTLRSSRTKETVMLRIFKTVEPVANPLDSHDRSERFGVLAFAGYTLRSTLEFTGRSRKTAVGLWNLLQMPHGGQMLIPTHARSGVRVYFGRVSSMHLTVSDRLIRYAMCAKGDAKIGVRARGLTGRVGYLYGSGLSCTLIVRQFGINPSGVYVDVPWKGRHKVGDAFQACSVNNAAIGAFSELEYHVPAIGGATGLTRCEDVSQVWAFRGSLPAIRRAAAALLGREASTLAASGSRGRKAP